MNDPVWIFAEQRVNQSPVDAREALTVTWIRYACRRSPTALSRRSY